MTRLAVTIGVPRATIPDSAAYEMPAPCASAAAMGEASSSPRIAATDRVHTACPVWASTQFIIPPQSGKKSCPPTTAGVAEMSPAAANFHCTVSPVTDCGVMELFRAVRVLHTFCPYMGQSPESASRSSGAAVAAASGTPVPAVLLQP